MVPIDPEASRSLSLWESDLVMRFDYLLTSPELQTARAPVPGEKANVVHTGATVITNIVSCVEITCALAPPLPRL